jgi:hypothetical protein
VYELEDERHGRVLVSALLTRRACSQTKRDALITTMRAFLLPETCTKNREKREIRPSFRATRD